MPAHMTTVIRPSPLLVRMLTAGAIAAAVAVAITILIAPVLGYLAIVLALASLDWHSCRADPEPRLEREMPERLVKGQPATIRYRVSRPSGGATTVSILDEMPAVLGGDVRIDDVRVGSGQSVELTRETVPARRGIFASGPVMILWRSRSGLFRLRANKLSGGTMRILPPATPAHRHPGLTHRTLREELGMRPRAARGEGREFESLREYVPGDDPRHVDWRASARRGRLIVRQYQTERRHTVMIAVDTGRLMAARVGDASKLDHALNCATALARASREFADRVGFLAFDRELRAFVRPRSGPAAIGAIVDAAVRLKTSPVEPDYRVLVQTLAQQQRKRALVVVLTDFVEGSASRELEAYLAVLARRHAVLLVAMRDRILAELDERQPEITRAGMYRRLALQDLGVEREEAIASIARMGAQTLDLDAARITAPVLNRYLAIRQAALL
jgi:uncharacterized protein (DUF58 family)